MIRIPFSSWEQGLADLTLLIAQDQSSRPFVKKGIPDKRMKICQVNTAIVRAILHKEVWDADDYAEMQAAMARLGRLARSLSQSGMVAIASSFFQLAAQCIEEMRQCPNYWAEGSISMAQMVLAEFSWFEMYELVSSAIWGGEGADPETQKVSKQIDALLDLSEDSRTFLLTLEESALPSHQGEDEVQLTGEAVKFFATCLDQRLDSEPHCDGECADNDILDVLLPLQEKLRACCDASEGTTLLLIRPL